MVALSSVLAASSSARVALVVNQGGPDGYGYRFIDNINESAGPVYSSVFQDIASSGTSLGITGDEQSTTISPNMMIRFYGQNWGTAPANSGATVVSADIGVSTNGFLRLLGASQTMIPGPYTPTAMPSSDTSITPGGFIAAWWRDLNGNGANDTAQWQVVGTAPNRTLIVQWTNWGYFGAGGQSDMTVQIQIGESSGSLDSDIHFVYVGSTDAVEGGSDCTIGIQSPNGSNSLQYSSFTASSTTANSSGDPRVIKFYTANPSDPAPDPAVNVAQSGTQPESSFQAQADASQRSGWTFDQMAFSAVISDPDATQQVRFRVRVKQTTSSTWTFLDSGLQAQGSVTLPYTVPGSGDYDWEYRVEDQYGNSSPSPSYTDPAGWLPAFSNNNSPDFRSDQTPPVTPVPSSPSNVDIQSPDPAYTSVTLQWLESTDNGPASALSYDVEVSRNADFTNIEAQASVDAVDQVAVILSVARDSKFWRLRARDVAGIQSPWSPALPFRVTFDDGIDHGSGDAGKACGMGAAPGTGSSTAALLAVMILSIATVLRLCGKPRCA